ncbi:acetyl-CoA hydrolase/transferase C-terminal domain-containing protein [Pseudonocardia sp. GCM10023141]|uniref:acetyl-CoA hydrolase/transferase C-terminal domain-containing protein n=1 Tax=Pseudonocardia sp. GCM10023141 TaxID=3252653 RepID=UPI00361C6739
MHLVFGMRRTPPELPFAPSGHFTIGTFVPGRGLRGIAPISYHRKSYEGICAALVSGEFRPDVVITCATPPDEQGRRTLGGIVSYLDLAMARAGRVVVEEVAWLPYIAGSAPVPDDCEVLAVRPAPTGPTVGFSADHDEIDARVAAHIADLLPDRPRLALGIGRIPDALALSLAGRGDVEVLTGVVTEAVAGMAADGALADATIRSMSVVGPPSLLLWAAGADVVLSSSTTIQSPSWLGGQDRFVAVLGALSVDGAGNVNSERIGSRTVSGLGGAPDFARGAAASANGLCIVAVRSSDAHGKSRLVDVVEDPTLDGAWVGAVATEHGAVRLTGLRPAERRRALAAIF